MTQKTPVSLWFDPLCPYAWVTSRWLLEVEKVRPIEISWRIMSLQVLNQDKDVSDDYRARIARVVGPGRTVAAVAAKYDGDAVGRYYTELGTLLHNEQHAKREGSLRPTVEEALVAAGLDKGVADAMDSDQFDEAVRISHDEGMALVGQEVGTPVIRVGANAFFGPVITSILRGEDAGRLWDGVLLVTEFEDFFELKRTRTRSPRFD